MEINQEFANYLVNVHIDIANTCKIWELPTLYAHLVYINNLHNILNPLSSQIFNVSVTQTLDYITKKSPDKRDQIKACQEIIKLKDKTLLSPFTELTLPQVLWKNAQEMLPQHELAFKHNIQILSGVFNGGKLPEGPMNHLVSFMIDQELNTLYNSVDNHLGLCRRKKLRVEEELLNNLKEAPKVLLKVLPNIIQANLDKIGSPKLQNLHKSSLEERQEDIKSILDSESPNAKKQKTDNDGISHSSGDATIELMGTTFSKSSEVEIAEDI